MIEPYITGLLIAGWIVLAFIIICNLFLVIVVYPAYRLALFFNSLEPNIPVLEEYWLSSTKAERFGTPFMPACLYIERWIQRYSEDDHEGE